MKKILLLGFVLCTIQTITSQNSKQAIAETWIQENFSNLRANQSFDMLFSRKGPSGETFRFYHTMNGVEVFGSSVAVHVSNKDKVSFHSSSFDVTVLSINTTPTISGNEALEIARRTLNISDGITQKEVQLYVYNKLPETVLVYRVATLSESLNGYWETIVDAQSGAVLSTKDIALYHTKNAECNTEKETELCKNQERPVMATGTAMVYDPDPLTKTTSPYGGNYSDNGDATNSQLDAARTAVTLLDIENTGGNFRLRGPYVEIAELQNPSTGLFIQGSSDFSFTRDQQGFEAANCYHHLDKNLRYINETLGITLVSLFNGGVLRYDPHAFNGADNSSYGGGSLNFGEGGVDDGEDMDVILHELGHGLHDWVTNGNLSQVNGLSEGTGDYWANSYKRSLGFWNNSDPAYEYVFGWDGHNEFWNGRTTGSNGTYPGSLVGQVHADGQIWSSALMEIWEIVGREKMDAAVLEGLAMTGGTTNQEQAAIAVRQAAIDMGYTCTEINAFTNRFEARGYTLPNYTCSMGACAITAITATNISPCDNNGTPNNSADDNFSADIVVTFIDAPTTGTLDLTGDGTASVSVTGLSSPHTFVNINMPADGTAIALTATFSAETSCTLTDSNTGMAPASCSTPPPACEITNITATNISPCDDNGTPNDNTDDNFSADIVVTFSNAPATGTLDLTGDGTASVSVTGLSSPHTFVNVNMPADGGPIALTATFSAEPSCTLIIDNTGMAPASCSTPPPSCEITNITATNISPCDDNGTPNDNTDDNFSADIVVTFSNAPATGTLDLTGDGTASVSVTGLSSPHTFVNVNMPADGGPIALTATFSAEPSCTLIIDNTGMAPASCSTLGNEDVAKEFLSLYPNPASDILNISNVKEDTQLTLYNLIGQRLLEFTVNPGHNAVDLTALPSGIYMLRTSTSNVTYKIVKQ